MLPIVLALAVSSAAPLSAFAASDPVYATVTIGGMTSSGRAGSAEFGAGEIVARRADGTLLVLTAKHVVADLAAPRVYLRDDVPTGSWVQRFFSPRTGRAAAIVAVARAQDLALLAVRPLPGDRYAIARFGDDQPAGGTVIGDPYGAAWTTSTFALLDAPPGELLVRCARCGPGDSGGGVFDADGRLAGILIQRQTRIVDGRSDATGVFKAIALAPVRRFVAGVAPRRIPARALANAGGVANSAAWARFRAARGGP